MKLFRRTKTISGKDSHNDRRNSQDEYNDHFENDVYTSIKELPIHNWNEITSTGDLTYLYRNGGKPTVRLVPIWNDIQQQHIDEFGVSPELMSIERLKMKLVKLNLKFIETLDRVLLNFIKIAEYQLEEKLKIKGLSFGKLHVLVSKFMGHYADTKKISVYTWFHTLKMMADGKGQQG